MGKNGYSIQDSSRPAILAVSAGIALLVNDYKVWKEGGKSAIGDTWKLFDDFVNFLKPLFNGLKKFFLGVSQYILGVFTLDFGKMTDATFQMVEGLKRIWDGYKGYVKDAAKSILSFVYVTPEEYKKIGDFFLGKNKDKDKKNILNNDPGAAIRPSLTNNNNNNNKTSTSSHSTSIGPITINTNATDADGIVRDFSAAIKRNGSFINQAEGGMI